MICTKNSLNYLELFNDNYYDGSLESTVFMLTSALFKMLNREE
jgi:hypothetical protein